MKVFVMCKGLPASGKTTWATRFVLDYPVGKATRVNRDTLRTMLNADRFKGDKTEMLITAARDTLIDLAMERGLEYVISDDTNFHPSCERAFRVLCEEFGYDFEVKDFTHVDVEECIKRDLKRQASVGERVIRKMWRTYLAGGPIEPPVFIPGKPTAVMVDIDGTVALMNGRSPYDPTLYHTDMPNAPVVQLVQQLHAAGDTIIFCSGRDDEFYSQTRAWLTEHVKVPVDRLFMRRAGDRRKDAIVKGELYEQNIRGMFNVRFVLDDRNQVVDMWRDRGLTVLQVADGNF